MSRHACCPCFTLYDRPCCNEGHVDWTGAQAVRKAWAESPLLRSLRALRDEEQAAMVVRVRERTVAEAERLGR